MTIATKAPLFKPENRNLKDQIVGCHQPLIADILQVQRLHTVHYHCTATVLFCTKSAIANALFACPVPKVWHCVRQHQQIEQVLEAGVPIGRACPSIQIL